MSNVPSESIVACAAGELAAARFLVEVDAPPSP